MRQGDRDTVAGFERAVSGLERVLDAQRVSGEPGYRPRVATADLAAFQRLYDERPATLPGVQRLTSTLVLKHVVREATARVQRSPGPTATQAVAHRR